MRTALVCAVAVALAAALSACSPRAAPLGARVGAGGEVEALVPECAVGTYAVLLYAAGEGPGAAPLQQTEVPDDGGSVPMGVTLSPGERYELTLAQTSFELGSLDLEALAEDEVLAAEGGAGTARIMTAEEWAATGDDFCSAGDREVLLLGAVALGMLLVAIAVVIGSVRAWRARRRPRVLLTIGLVVTGCLGWAALVALWVHADRPAAPGPPGTGPWAPGPWAPGPSAPGPSAPPGAGPPPPVP